MWHMVYTPYSLIQTSVLHEMPVFAPNEYFWRHHWDSKEEKWVAYARAVRELMSAQGKFGLSDLSMEDKLIFKNVWHLKKSSQ